MRVWQPMRMFSNTVALGNSARFWNVRPMPRAAIAWAGRSRMERPSSSMPPEVVSYSLLRQLNSVVFPAPLGPMSPTIFCLGTSKLT
ncbi:hypothetical protein D3C71_1983370 [compost metagenome]